MNIKNAWLIGLQNKGSFFNYAMLEPWVVGP